MSWKRILGFLVLIAGVGMMLVSNYILKQVGEGREKISDAESKVQQGESLFSLNPVSKQVGKGLTGSAKKKIAAGKEEVMKYEDLAGKLKIGGLVAAGLGVLLVLLGGKRKSSSR